MNIYELKSNYTEKNPEGMFFDADMLARSGERIDRMKVTGKGVMHTRNCGDVICYEVVAEQENILGTREVRYYFDEESFEMFVPA